MALLKTIGPPGSPGFLVVSLVIGFFLGYVWPRKRRLGHAWILAVVAGYLVMSWPPAAQVIVNTLPAPAPTALADVATPLDVLVIFDGDNRKGRVRAAEMIVAGRSPRRIYVIGSRWILEEIAEPMLGRITHDATSANTREQMAWVERFLARRETGVAAVVASRIQVPRVKALAARSGLHVAVIASPLDVELPVTGMSRLIPTYAALCASRDAVYEHAALAYYGWRGWI